MKIILEPYSPLWKDTFEKERLIIATALNKLSPVIEHIGSTSVEGLAAKPVIDILVGLKTETDLEHCILPMQHAGYTYNKFYEPTMPYRRYFIHYKHPQNIASPILFDSADSNPLQAGFINVSHIHILVHDTQHRVRHIAFRDYLRTHIEARKDYEALKLELAKRDFESSLEYSFSKNDFIQSMEIEAMRWFEHNYRTSSLILSIYS